MTNVRIEKISNGYIVHFSNTMSSWDEYYNKVSDNLLKKIKEFFEADD